MRSALAFSAFVVSSLFLISLAAAQSNPSPTMFLSSNEVSFFNGDQGSLDVTVTNNDREPHTFTISVFPSNFDDVFSSQSRNHVTLASGQSETFQVSFSSLFEAEFVPREFSITVSATDDATLSASKDVFVRILRRSPVFVLSLNTNKFSYLPGETLNVSYVVANNGGDSFDTYTIQTVILSGGNPLKRFESTISFLPEKSKNSFSNLYTFDQFSAPGTYSVQLTLRDEAGQTVNVKSVNVRVGEVSKTSQTETSSAGILDSTTTVTSRNEGNSPADIVVTATIPAFAKDLFDSDIEPSSTEDIGTGTKVTWVFENVPANGEVQVVYKIVVWKIWVSILGIIIVVFLAFRLVFTVKIMKRSTFGGSVKKDAEIPVSIEVVNRSLHEVKDVVIRDQVPSIATVVPKFQTVKPDVHKTAHAYEVVWKFDSLRPGEERVVTYRIKPKMDVLGSLRLNPATVSYSTKDRKKRSAASGMVVVRKLE